MKILLIEDDDLMAQTLQETLSGDFVAEVASSALEGEDLINANSYDLIVLDLNLPDLNGIKLCQKIRQEGIVTPILILTGENELQTKVEALDAGADDYLTKPFRIEELKARVRALLRRPSQGFTSNMLHIDDLVLDLDKKVVQRGHAIIHLRRKEFDLLEYLLRNAGKVLTRNMILEHVWDSSYDSLGNTVDVHVKYLRDHIDRMFHKKLIKTVHGLGYKIEA
jgi:DNA-binding response OmpR family regulator